MAPFDGKLTTKISPLIEGQVPDFVQADHPKFVSFVKSFYQFLEAAELIVTVTIDSIRQETVSTSFILSEGDVPVKINTETGTGTTGKFVANETITGSTSKATATVLVDDLGNKRLFISSQQKFEVGETITGSTSDATATIDSYRANPVQNMQQLLEYANTDNTTTVFLDEMFNMFLESIPKTLASGVAKRDLIKNIKDLYTAKGTSEGHKLFLRILFDEESEIVYPNKFMLRASKGNWSQPTIMRVAAVSGSDALDITGQTITGSTSGATSVILNTLVIFQGNTSVSELEIDPRVSVGTFQTGETITASSNTQDVLMSFVIKSFVAGSTITEAGAHYSVNDPITIDPAVGNNFADAEVSEISTGSVTGTIIDDIGSLYRVGDPLVFTPNAADTTVESAQGFVSVIDGSILLEDTDNNDDFLIQEPNTNQSIVNFTLVMEGTDDSRSNAGDQILIDATNGSALDDGYYILTEQTTRQQDIIGSDNDRFQIEAGAADTEGSISRIVITDPGGGYSKLPTISITSTAGTGGLVTSTSTDIGQITSIKIKDGGFGYDSDPSGTFDTHFIVKDVTGSFLPTSPFTTTGHVGTVKAYNDDIKLLTATIENRERIEFETVGVDVTQGIELESPSVTGKFIQLDNVLESHTDHFIANRVITHFLSIMLLEDGSGALITDALETYINQIDLEQTLGTTVNQFVQLENEVTTSRLLLDRTDSGGTDAGDEILFEDEKPYPDVQIIRDKFQLNGTGRQRFTTGGWITDDGTNDPRTITTFEDGGFRSVDAEANILLEDEVADATVNTREFLLMENRFSNSNAAGDYEFVEQITIKHDNTDAVRIIGESYEPLILETSLLDAPTGGDSSDLVLDFHILPGLDVDLRLLLEDGNPIIQKLVPYDFDVGGFVIDEEFGFNIKQESGLDIGSFPNDLGDALLTEGEFLEVGYTLLDGTDSSSTNAGSYLISESDPDFRTNVISDAGGASATIVNQYNAKVTMNSDITSEKEGFYKNTDHHISDGVIRLQDSFFYQDFSYEIKIGQSVGTYITELKKATHPTGFAVFGKVTLASSIAANIQIPTAGGVTDYTGDTERFSPELASFLENIFQVQIKRRLGIPNPTLQERTGLFQRMLLEAPYVIRFEDDSGYEIIDNASEVIQQEGNSDYVVLDGTDGSSTNAGDHINSETDNAGSFILGDETLVDENIITDNTSERISSEEAPLPPTGNRDVSLLQKITLTMKLPDVVWPVKAGSRSGLPLFAETQVIANGFELEDGTKFNTPTINRFVIIADGIVQSSGAIGDIGSALDLEDATDADFGSGLTFDDLQFRSNDLFALEQASTFNDIVSLESGTDTQVDVNTPNLLLLDRTDSGGSHANSRVLHQDDTNSYGDNFILDGTDSSSTDAGSNFVTEDVLSGEITIEEIVRTPLLVQEGRGLGDDIDTEYFQMENSDSNMEEGDLVFEQHFDGIFLDGTDSSSSDTENYLLLETGNIIVQENSIAGNNMLIETETSPQRSGKMLLDSQLLQAESGSTIPEINFTSETNFPHFTRPAMIRTRAHGHISLQDDREVVFMVLDGTDGSSTNAGDNIIFDRTLSTGQDAGDDILAEEGTKRILDQHNPGLVVFDQVDAGGTFAGGKIDLEAATFLSLVGTGPVQTLVGGGAPLFSSTQTSWDGTGQTFDETT